MATLDLVLKYTYYDMILTGIKREEYREIKPYWTKRINRSFSSCRLFREVNRVRFHRGYTSTTMTYAVREVVIDTGKPEWGAKPDKKYYVIRLGKRLI